MDRPAAEWSRGYGGAGRVASLRRALQLLRADPSADS